MPSQTSRGRNSVSDRLGAADVIRIAVRERDVVEPPRTRRRRITGATTRSPMSKADEDARPPASTSSVEPRGKTTKIASPWPTSMNVDVQPPVAPRGDQRARLEQDPDGRYRCDERRGPPRATCQHRLRAAATRRSATARASTSRRARRSSRRPRVHAGGATRQLSTGTNCDEIGRPDETRGADVRDPSGQRRQPPATRAPPARRTMPAICATAISGIARKFSDQAGERHARKQERADREQHRFGRERRGEQHRDRATQASTLEASLSNARAANRLRQACPERALILDSQDERRRGPGRACRDGNESPGSRRR